MTLSKRQRAAFSLVEIMIAVAIVADLALIAIPSFTRARRTAQASRLCEDMRVITDAFTTYNIENLRYPPEAAGGVVPTGMEQYLHQINFSGITSIGGNWDYDYDQGYAIAALCVQLPITGDLIQMQDVDQRVDNGVLATGFFRQRTPSRFTYIME